MAKRIDPTVDELTRLTTGALRSAIDSHGPITRDLVASASKRVVGTLMQWLDDKNPDLGILAVRHTAHDLGRENKKLRKVLRAAHRLLKAGETEKALLKLDPERWGEEEQ